MGGELSKDYSLSGSASSEPSQEAASSVSPRPSISCDADLPYISYTVNRPIGESPKRLIKGRVLHPSGPASPRRLRRKGASRPSEIMVVREGSQKDPQVDPQLSRLQSIPSFLPIMRAALTAPAARDPEVLERLDSCALLGLLRRYEAHLYGASFTVSSAQDQLTARIKEVDSLVKAILSASTERQKSFARYAEKLSQVTEVSHALTRCHASLNLLLESMDTLNNHLAIQNRLEPFVWTTG